MSIETIVLAWLAAALVVGALWALAGWMWGQARDAGAQEMKSCSLPLCARN